MERTHILILLAIAIIFLSSCHKYFVCYCDTTTTDSSGTHHSSWSSNTLTGLTGKKEEEKQIKSCNAMGGAGTMQTSTGTKTTTCYIR